MSFRKFRLYFWGLLLLFCVTCTGVFNFWLPPLHIIYNYRSDDGVHELLEHGRAFANLRSYFSEKKEDGTPLILYRCFSFPPHYFWYWGEYLFHPRWRVPYKKCPDLIKGHPHIEIWKKYEETRKKYGLPPTRSE
jgi:hypothetical protein